jgi:hypothetical protein
MIHPSFADHFFRVNYSRWEHVAVDITNTRGAHGLVGIE